MRRQLREAIRNFWYLGLHRPRLAVRSTDGFLASWPRSGNTWLRYMLAEVLRPGNDLDMEQIEDIIPILDRPDFAAALHAIESNPPPRLFKSHELFEPYFLTGKIVYLVRDPRDAIPSFFKYRTERSRWTKTWDDFFNASSNNRFRYGSWQHNVSGYLEHSDHHSLLIVRYEDMLADTLGELRRIVDHLGLKADDALIAQAVERSSVSRVSRGFTKVAERRGLSFKGGSGGGSGKGRELFSAAQLDQLQQHAGDLMQCLGYTD